MLFLSTQPARLPLKQARTECRGERSVMCLTINVNVCWDPDTDNCNEHAYLPEVAFVKETGFTSTLRLLQKSIEIVLFHVVGEFSLPGLQFNQKPGKKPVRFQQKDSMKVLRRDPWRRWHGLPRARLWRRHTRTETPRSREIRARWFRDLSEQITARRRNARQ